MQSPNIHHDDAVFGNRNRYPVLCLLVSLESDVIDAAIVRSFGFDNRRARCKSRRTEGGIDRSNLLQTGLDREAAEDFTEEGEGVRELLKVAAVRRRVDIVFSGPYLERLFA